MRNTKTFTKSELEEYIKELEAEKSTDGAAYRQLADERDELKERVVRLKEKSDDILTDALDGLIRLAEGVPAPQHCPSCFNAAGEPMLTCTCGAEASRQALLDRLEELRP